MKDRILNLLMLFSVAAALVFTLLNNRTEAASPVLSAFPTLAPTASPLPVDAYRARRAGQRQTELSALSALADNPLAEEEIRSMAQMQLSEMIRKNETELAVEAALIARGYPDALCIFHAGVLTVLFTTPLEQTDAHWILHLAREISGLEAENIRLSAC